MKVFMNSYRSFDDYPETEVFQKTKKKDRNRREDDEYQPRVDPKRKKNRDYSEERKIKRGEE